MQDGWAGRIGSAVRVTSRVCVNNKGAASPGDLGLAAPMWQESY